MDQFLAALRRDLRVGTPTAQAGLQFKSATICYNFANKDSNNNSNINNNSSNSSNGDSSSVNDESANTSPDYFVILFIASSINDIFYLKDPIGKYSSISNSRIYIVLSDSEHGISRAFDSSSLKDLACSGYSIISDPELSICRDLAPLLADKVDCSSSAISATVSAGHGSALAFNPDLLPTTATILLDATGSLLKYQKFNVSCEYDTEAIASCLRAHISGSHNKNHNSNINSISSSGGSNGNIDNSNNNSNGISSKYNAGKDKDAIIDSGSGSSSSNNSSSSQSSAGGCGSGNETGKGSIEDDSIFLQSLSQFAAYYKAQLKEKPLQTKAITSCIISIFGETLGSYLKYRKYLSKNPQKASSTSLTSFLDPKRFVIFGFYGLAITAPTFHWWYGFLERFVSARQMSFVKVVLTKLGLDRLLLTPPFLAFTLIYLQFTQTLDMSQTMRNVKNQYAAALFMNWKIWTPAQVVNFTVVPVDYRVLFGNMVALWWNIYLSLVS